MYPWALRFRVKERRRVFLMSLQYIASFPVTGEGQEDKSEYIKRHLLELNVSILTVLVFSVLIVFSSSCEFMNVFLFVFISLYFTC